jgi:hydroxymethylpyrimidine/phosphomethylpyrimidine kinase
VIRPIPIALTIAGSDSSGGAGIQADLKTFAARGVYGASVITAITAQNTMGVTAVHAVPVEIVAAQIQAVLSDLDVTAVKIGMVFSADITASIATVLAERPDVPVVLDPVMIATSGARLMDQRATGAIVTLLLPRALCITPNLAEAAELTAEPMAADEAAMIVQARRLLALGAQSVLMKGGHATGNESVDLLVTATETHRFVAPRISTRNLHGTGCTLASAITAELSRGVPLINAVGIAKRYVTQAILAAVDRPIGHGHGPLHHHFAAERAQTSLETGT